MWTRHRNKEDNMPNENKKEKEFDINEERRKYVKPEADVWVMPFGENITSSRDAFDGEDDVF
jgi:hypothetical protein